MATTSLLLMASDKDKTMKPPPALCGGSSEEELPKTTESSTRSGRGRKANNGKGPKKQPQRGMGVAQLESILRNQEMNQMHRSSPSSSSVITPPLLSPSSFPVNNEPFAGNLPLHYAAPTKHGPLNHCPPPPPPLMFNGNVVIPGGPGQGPTVGTTTAYNAGFNVLSGGFGAPAWNPLVGCPLETSRELSSMPNPHSESHPCDSCFKKKRFTDNNNIARGSNTRRDNNALDIWSSMIHGNPDHFLGFPPQQAPNLPPETTDFTTIMSTHNNAHSYHNLDESVGVVAVHRKTMSGKIVKEYEFFPGKEDLRGTTFKELGLSLVGSSSSSITATVASARAHRINADTTATATAASAAASSNSVDLSLRL